MANELQIHNVVCNFSLPMHIDLRKLALASWNTIFCRNTNVMVRKKRNPNCTVNIYNSGKVFIVGTKSEADARIAARSVGRWIQKTMGKTSSRMRLRNYQICNILATVKFPFGVQIEQMNRKYPHVTTYEPELDVGLIYRSAQPKATLRINATGTVSVCGAQSEKDVVDVINTVYPKLLEFRCDPRCIPAAKKRKPSPVVDVDPVIRLSKRPKLEDVDYSFNNQFVFDDEADIDQEYT